ncbi:transglycosylase SLT domain-containing protein [Methylobacterium sp. 285MFTsu5.1]|uniref:transglycosylase SLT domain-containing protein n=1 Tax=Methylobacterium sp. 285MFTsu5.1 TaxID=1172187 RepID=UPI00037E79E1|nr:transglycosylase SLT domain-containing protein [Methylobacterium sp. 285MFTsu5.1]
MSFSQEIRDFIGAFKVTHDTMKESLAERRAREEDEDRANIRAAADTAEGAVGGYPGAASTAQPGSRGYGAGTGSARMRQAVDDGGDGTVRNASLQEKADRSIPAFAAQAGTQYGISPSYMKTTAMVESQANPNAVSSTGADGPYQFTRGTAQRMGLQNPRDWRQSSAAAAKLAAENRDQIEAAIGRPVSDEEMYLGHNQGAAGATALLRDPNANAAQALARAYKGDVNKAAHALRVNGVNPGWTAGQAVKTLTGKYRKNKVAQALPADDDSAPETGEMPTQMAADGGRVRGPDEIEEVQTQGPDVRARMRRPADAPWMSRQVPEVAPQGSTVSAETVPSDDEANEVTPARMAIPEVDTQAPVAVHAEGPDGTQRARSADTVAAPAPPARPSAEDLQAPAPARPHASAPTRRQAGAPVTQPGNRPDSGAALPGEGMQPGDDAPDGAQPRATALHQNRELTAQASKGALDYISEMLGVNRAALPGEVPQTTGSLRQLTRNAATPAEVAEVDRTVDPRGEMNDAARAVARLNAGYDYYLKKGEPEKALKYAASMVLYARSHSMMAGQMAQEALRHGNVRGAAQAITEAHNQLPDGSALQVQSVDRGGVSYAVVDTDGNLTSEGRANLDEMMHLATGMSNGSVWLQQMGELTRVLPKAPSQSQQLRERMYADKQAKAEAQEAARNDFDDAATPESDEFLGSLNPQQRQAYAAMDARGKGRARREWSNEQKRKLTEAKAESAAMGKEKAAQDEQEFSAYANQMDAAQHELDALDPNDVQNTAAIEAAKAKVQEARDAALKWSEADPGRARFGNQLRGGRLGAGGARQGAGSRQAVPDSPIYGSPPRGATKEQKDDAQLDAEVRQGRNDMMRDGLVKPGAVQKFDLTRADVEFRRRYGKEADLEVQKAVDETLPKEMTGQDRFAMRHVAEQIAGANGMMPDEAINVANEALAAGGQFTVTQDGKVQFGSAPPVFLGRSGLLALAGIVGRRQPQQPMKSAANPMQRPSPARERMAAEDSAGAARTAIRLHEDDGQRRAAQRADRRKNLGADYRDWMSDEDEAQALKDRGEEGVREARKSYRGQAIEER